MKWEIIFFLSAWLGDAANTVYDLELGAPIWSLIHKCVKKTEIWNHLADIDQHFRYKF